MFETLLYRRLDNGRVQCDVCQRRCRITEGNRGYCFSRLNQAGKLYCLLYGQVSTVMVAPIEKKPLFHFYPGSHALSFGTLGCNFRCPGCQNWEDAHDKLDFTRRWTTYISPEESMQMVKEYDCQGISWTYNEPTVWFEYTLDGAKLAKDQGLYTNYVTNGYMTPEALDMIGPYLDAFRVDIKGFAPSSYGKIAHISDFSGILAVTKRAKIKWGMHVEIVTNVIPGYNDDEAQLRNIAHWICTELGEETPWHVTRFIPYLKLSHLEPTPIATLERARQIGFEAGLQYVYLGNVPGHRGENTYCPQCKKLLIERDVFSVKQMNVEKGKCPYCGLVVAGIFL